MTGDENSKLVQIESKETNILRTLCKCLYKSNEVIEPNILTYSVKFSENKHDCFVEVKSSSGKKEILDKMIITIISAIAKYVKNIKLLRKSNIPNIEDVLQQIQIQRRMNDLNLYGPADSNQTLTEEEFSVIDHSTKEASNYYEIYRLLSQENYELGRSVNEFIYKFKEENKDFTISSECIPKQMKDVLKLIDECVATFHRYFNLGKSNTEKLLQYSRPAIEKFLFNKIYFVMYELYNAKYEKENLKFIEIQSKIKEKYKIDEIMNYLEIRKKFQGTDSSGKSLPFKYTIDCINKIEFERTPKEKLEALMKASLEMRNSVLGLTGGKVIYSRINI